MDKTVIIIGTGGQARVIADIVINNKDKIIGFLDEDPTRDGLFGYPMLGHLSSYKKHTKHEFFIAIGDGAIRQRIYEQLDGVQYYRAIHPNAVIGEMVSIGEGTAVMAGAVICPNTMVGKQSIINTMSIVEHDGIVGDFVHISPNGTLCGTVVLGDRVVIGAGTTVVNNLSICNNVVIGAGGLVVKSIDSPGTYVGVPVVKK